MVGLVVGIFDEWVLSLFFINDGSFKKDSMNGDNPKFILGWNLVRISTAILECVRNKSYAWLMFYLIYSVASNFAVLYIFVFRNGALAFKSLRNRHYF